MKDVRVEASTSEKVWTFSQLFQSLGNFLVRRVRGSCATLGESLYFIVVGSLPI